MSVHEGANASDLNGDGDQDDTLLAIIDVETDTRDFRSHLEPIELWDNLMLCEADEAGLGDLNGDGDVTDHVLSTLHLDTLALVDHDIATEGSFLDVRLESNRFLFPADEVGQGTDLNGDGDIEDRFVAHLFNLETGRIHNLGISIDGQGVLSRAGIVGTSVLFPVNETIFTLDSEREETDLNDDGDFDDSIVHLYDETTETLLNTGLALNPHAPESLFAVSGTIGIFTVLEDIDDLNRDEDNLDEVLHSFDVRSRTFTNHELATPPFFPRVHDVVGTRAIVLVNEGAQGASDLTGDGTASFDSNAVVLIDFAP